MIMLPNKRGNPAAERIVHAPAARPTTSARDKTGGAIVHDPDQQTMRVASCDAHDPGSFRHRQLSRRAW